MTNTVWQIRDRIYNVKSGIVDNTFFVNYFYQHVDFIDNAKFAQLRVNCTNNKIILEFCEIVTIETKENTVAMALHFLNHINRVLDEIHYASGEIVAQ